PQIAADRYTYLAGLGWAILAGASALSHWRRRPFLLTGLAACVLFGLEILTWNQVQVWHDSEKLWAHALAIDSKNSMAHFNFGNMLVQQGKSAEADEHYRQALQIKPNSAEVHTNLGVVLGQQGKLAEAIVHYRQALQINPDFGQARSNLLNALPGVGIGKKEAAASHKGEKTK